MTISERFPSVLITGCSGDIAVALARIIKELHPSIRLYGCDMSLNALAYHFFDDCREVSAAKSSAWESELLSYAQESQISAILPMSEAELQTLVDGGFSTHFHGIPLLKANNLAITVGLDKWRTHELLSKSGVGVARTQLVNDVTNWDVPFIIKPRFGRGSKSVQIIKSRAEIPVNIPPQESNQWLCQELLEPLNEEHTCGLFRSMSGETRTIILKRRLSNGVTSEGIVCNSDIIADLLVKLADAIELIGSVNVQLIMTSEGPKVFEINPRFSSTVMFRHKLGFRDAQWSLQDLAGQQLSVFKKPSSGTRFFRSSQEILIRP